MFVIFALWMPTLILVWFISLRVDNGTRAADVAPGYGVSKHIRYTFTLQNRSSRRVEGAGSATSCLIRGLSDNARHHWRVKTTDGFVESPWSAAGLLVDTTKDPLVILIGA